MMPWKMIIFFNGIFVSLNIMFIPGDHGTNLIMLVIDNSNQVIIFVLIISLAKCGIYGNLLSQFSDKNFVKATFLLKKLLKSWFH